MFSNSNNTVMLRGRGMTNSSQISKFSDHTAFQRVSGGTMAGEAHDFNNNNEDDEE
jgi:hypothetical protein